MSETDTEHELRVLRSQVMKFNHVVIDSEAANNVQTSDVPIWLALSLHASEYGAWTLAHKLTKETGVRYTVRKLQEDSL